MILRAGQTYRTPTGYVWQVTDEYPDRVEARSLDVPGLTATIQRRELAKWEVLDRRKQEEEAA